MPNIFEIFRAQKQLDECQGTNKRANMGLIFFRLEYVPEALAADDVAGVGTKFLAKTGDVDVDGAVGDDDTFPNAVHELLTREDLAAILEKQAEQVELSASEAGGLTVDGDSLAVEIHLHAAKAE